MSIGNRHTERPPDPVPYGGRPSGSFVNSTVQWRIQDFPQGGAPTPKIAIIFHIFAENCMKMKEFGPPGGGARPWRPPLDPPMLLVVKGF